MMTSATLNLDAICSFALGMARIAFVGLETFEVVGLAIDEHHDVGVLLDRARFPKVGELRALVFALFDRTRQLGQRDDRDRQLLGRAPSATW